MADSEIEDEQATVYEALRKKEEGLRAAIHERTADAAEIASIQAEIADLRKRLDVLSEQVRVRMVQAAEEEHARMIAKIILR